MKVVGLFLLGLLPLCAAPGVRAEYPLPDSSRGEAKRQETWREALERAERAVAEDRWDDAEALYARVVEEARSAERPGMMLARAVDGLAEAHQHAERFVEAEQLYRESVALWQRLLGDGQPRVGISLYNLGLTYAALDRPDDARRTLTRALDVFESSLGPESGFALDTRRALERLGDG